MNHIFDSLLAAVAEVEGRRHEADHLYAQTKLRLLAMSDEEMWGLAELVSSPEQEAIEDTYESIKQAAREHSAKAAQWVKNL